MNIKRRVNNDIYQYIHRHNLLDKYFFNVSNINNNGYTMYPDPINFGSPKVKENFLTSGDSDRHRTLSFGNISKKSFENNDKEDETEIRKFKFTSPFKINTNCFNSNTNN